MKRLAKADLALAVCLFAAMAISPAGVGATDFTIPTNHLLTDAEFGTVAWGPGSLTRALGPDSSVVFTFIGLDTVATGVKDDYPVAAVYGQIGGTHNSDFSNFSGYALQMRNTDDGPIWAILCMNTGFTNPNINDDTYWQMTEWQRLDPGEAAILRLDFDNAVAYNISDNVPPHSTGSEGDTLAINATDRTEVTAIGFQVMDQSGTNDTVTIGISPPDIVAVDPSTVRCLNIKNPCDTVAMVFDRIDTTHVRGYSVTFQLSGELALCADVYSSIRQGPYLSGVGSTQFQVYDNGGGVYTADCAILGDPCGATGSGTLFTIDVKGSGGDGTGSITVTSVTVRDCTNGPVLCHPGSPAYVTIDGTAPAAVTDLAAVQVKTGNAFGSDTTGVKITFGAPLDASVTEVYRASYGNYPEYDDPPGAGSVPSAPSYPPGSPWVLTGVTASGQVDYPPGRDFWYYVVFTRDACGNPSLVSNMSGGTLNYHLGDVSDGTTIGHGDNRVTMADISLLGTYYWRILVPGDSVNYLDVGPTADYSVNGRPTTDNQVSFEDLMIFAMNFGKVSLMAERSSPVVECPRLRMVADGYGQDGDAVVARLLLEQNTGSVKGMHAAVRFDDDGLELLDVSRGSLLSSQASPVFFVHSVDNGTIQLDLAGLGNRTAIQGSGEIAVVRFARNMADVALPQLYRSDLRGVDNRRFKRAEPRTDNLVDEAKPSDRLSDAQLDMSSSPNPFSGGTDIFFNLPSSGQMTLEIYSVEGRLVRTLVEGTLPAGSHNASWDGRASGGRNLAPGTYMSVLTLGDKRIVTKLTLLP